MTQAKDFAGRLNKYKKLIDSDINSYAEDISKQASKVYGPYSEEVAKAYGDILKRGGKRIRGTLTCVGYEMCGGSDQKMIIQAARAIEMMHACLLIIDDIQDKSDMRRGGKSGHKLLEDIHAKKGWRGDSEHVGIALSLNSALLGIHGAELVLSNLNVSDDLRLKALNIMNHTMIVTAHGQTNDIANEMINEVTEQDINAVMQWKTAHYTFLNPIHMGMVLAGAPCEDTNAITQYALNIGKAFQITDDLLVISTAKADKDPTDDIKEGKRTLLTVYALEYAKKTDAEFLRKCLGNRELSKKDFEKCQKILVDSGATTYATQKAKQYVKTGLDSLREHTDRWNKSSVNFLDDLAGHLLKRAE